MVHRVPASVTVRLGAVGAVAALPLLARVQTTRSWVGIEALTSDEMPIIDRLDDGAALGAAGLGGHGFAIGPVVGRLLSEWLLDGKPSLDLSAFRMSRFLHPLSPPAASAGGRDGRTGEGRVRGRDGNGGGAR